VLKSTVFVEPGVLGIVIALAMLQPEPVLLSLSKHPMEALIVFRKPKHVPVVSLVQTSLVVTVIPKQTKPNTFSRTLELVKVFLPLAQRLLLLLLLWIVSSHFVPHFVPPLLNAMTTMLVPMTFAISSILEALLGPLTTADTQTKLVLLALFVFQALVMLPKDVSTLHFKSVTTTLFVLMIDATMP